MKAVAILNGLPSEAGCGLGDEPTPVRSRVSLRSLNEIADELARVYRMADRGKIEMAEATKRAFILHTLGKVIEAGVIEKRLTALEEKANGIAALTA